MTLTIKRVAIIATVAALAFMLVGVRVAAAQYYSAPATYTTSPYTYTIYQYPTKTQQIAYLSQLIQTLQAELVRVCGTSCGGQVAGITYGSPYYYYYPTNSGGSNSNRDEEPDVETDRARSITDDSARLEGSVDMNDFDDGEVFFVYGEDRNQIRDVEDDYDSYNDVDEDGNDLQKVRVDSSLDRDDDYSYTVRSLDDDTRYYFSLCVGYEDEDNDDVLACGSVEDFETD